MAVAAPPDDPDDTPFPGDDEPPGDPFPTPVWGSGDPPPVDGPVVPAPPPNPILALQPQLRAAGYELVGLIAQRGLGTVYAARNILLKTDVAIKVVPGVYANPGIVQLTARTAARLQHPGILSVFDGGTLGDGSTFIVMKLIPGKSLDEILRSRDGHPDEGVRIGAAFQQACAAVGYAHTHGVVHRNLKPSKVIVGELGEAVVIGWGLATVPADPTYQAGAIVGTPSYLAPELARGEPVDSRTDVFGLGGILCEILTGQPVFIAGPEGFVSVIQRAAVGDLDDTYARLDACGADPELIAMAKRCLSPRREDRPADGYAVAEVVAAYRARVARTGRRWLRRVSGRRWVVRGVIAVVLLYAGLYLTWLSFTAGAHR